MFALLLGVTLQTVGERPCDIYDAAGTPCVAAHSMTRALYAKYSGPLYRVIRASDNATKEVPVLSAGGAADGAAQAAFCAGTGCVVDRIFDQSSHSNHIDPAPGGGAHHLADAGVNANRAPLTLSGHPVYAAYFKGNERGPGGIGMGYRRENTSGVATGDAAESMYMVTSGTHYNAGCCFDYGNAEVDARDHGPGTMEAVYWGAKHDRSRGAGAGPWVMADLEDGLWAGDTAFNSHNVPVEAEYVTAMLKGRPGGFCLKGGDAASGSLTKMWEGPRPAGYNPMKKQGAIILGIGGDNSDSAAGTFYEGAITAGYSSDKADAAVQASIVAAGYGR